MCIRNFYTLHKSIHRFLHVFHGNIINYDPLVITIYLRTFKMAYFKMVHHGVSSLITLIILYHQYELQECW